MPDQISVSEFIAETTEDYNSPTTSSFTTRLHNCRNTVTLLEEGCTRGIWRFPGWELNRSLHHNYSNVGSDLHLHPIPQLKTTLDP